MGSDDLRDVSVGVESAADGHGHRVHLAGDIDYATAPALRRSLREFAGDVDLECGDVGFVDSAGIAALVTYERTLRENGGALHVTDVRPACYRVFEITGLVDLLDVHAREAP